MLSDQTFINIQNFIGKIITDFGKEILKFTPQLYIFNKFKSVPFASSILLNIQNKKFLITAGHALEDINKSTIGIFVGSDFCTLEGKVVYTDINETFGNKTKDNDKIDIAVWKLSSKCIKFISKEYNFFNLDLEDIDMAMPKSHDYLLVGFPFTKTKAKGHIRKYIVEPFIYHTKRLEIALYKELKVHPNTHVILHYDKQKIRKYGKSEIQVGPNLQGISGCGVWLLSRTGYIPVGIIIEGNSNHNAIIATRLNIVTETIRQKFKVNIPQTKIATININEETKS